MLSRFHSRTNGLLRAIGDVFSALPRVLWTHQWLFVPDGAVSNYIAGCSSHAPPIKNRIKIFLGGTLSIPQVTYKQEVAPMCDPCFGKSLSGAGEYRAGNLHFTIRENLMNALIRKFRVASTTGVVMSLAMAGVLAMAPMSNAMAKSQTGKVVKVEGSSPYSSYAAWSEWSVKSFNACGGLFNIKSIIKNGKKEGRLYILKTVNTCK